METAILMLSGGASRRMGEDKASLSINNTSLLNWQTQRFKSAGYQVISGLKDVYPGFLGPLAGIHAASAQFPNVESIFVIPVDMPQLQVETAELLITKGQAAQQACCFEDCPLPIFLPNTPELQTLLTRWLVDRAGKRSVYALMNELNGLWVRPISIENELMNINTPEQWQAYQEGAVIR
jgi:molybdopterin-guanine dinucleotide biosynthesis protein A